MMYMCTRRAEKKPKEKKSETVHTRVVCSGRLPSRTTPGGLFRARDSIGRGARDDLEHDDALIYFNPQ